MEILNLNYQILDVKWMIIHSFMLWNELMDHVMVLVLRNDNVKDGIDTSLSFSSHVEDSDVHIKNGEVDLLLPFSAEGSLLTAHMCVCPQV